MHSVLILIVFVVFLIYLASYVFSSLAVVIRKFWKKMPFTNLEVAWLIFLLGVFFPPPTSFSGITEFVILVLFVVINWFWFIPLVHFYEVRVKQRVTSVLYASAAVMILTSIMIIAGWYGGISESIWMPVSDVVRGITMGFSLLYCGYLVYDSDLVKTQAQKFEYRSLFGIGISAFAHGIFHIFVYGLGIVHDFEEIADASESFEVYMVILVELAAFAIGAYGFILLLINMIRNSDYRLTTENEGIENSSNSPIDQIDSPVPESSD